MPDAENQSVEKVPLIIEPAKQEEKVSSSEKDKPESQSTATQTDDEQ